MKFLEVYENPVSGGVLAALAVGGLVAAGIVVAVVIEKSAAAKTNAGGNTGNTQQPKVITVNFTAAVPGNQPTIHANAGDQIIFRLPGPPGSIAAAGGKWFDASTGGVKAQGQGFASDGVTWQMVFGVTSGGIMAVSHGAGAEVYAAPVVVP